MKINSNNFLQFFSAMSNADYSIGTTKNQPIRLQATSKQVKKISLKKWFSVMLKYLFSQYISYLNKYSNTQKIFEIPKKNSLY